MWTTSDRGDTAVDWPWLAHWLAHWLALTGRSPALRWRPPSYPPAKRHHSPSLSSTRHSLRGTLATSPVSTTHDRRPTPSTPSRALLRACLALQLRKLRCHAARLPPASLCCSVRNPLLLCRLRCRLRCCTTFLCSKHVRLNNRACVCRLFLAYPPPSLVEARCTERHSPWAQDPAPVPVPVPPPGPERKKKGFQSKRCRNNRCFTPPWSWHGPVDLFIAHGSLLRPVVLSSPLIALLHQPFRATTLPAAMACQPLSRVGATVALD